MNKISLVSLHLLLILPLGFCWDLNWPIYFRIGLVGIGLYYFLLKTKNTYDTDPKYVQIYKIVLAIIVIFIIIQFDPIRSQFPHIHNNQNSYWFFGITTLLVIFLALNFICQYRQNTNNKSFFILGVTDKIFIVTGFVSIFAIHNYSNIFGFPIGLVVAIKTLECTCIWFIFTRMDFFSGGEIAGAEDQQSDSYNWNARLRSMTIIIGVFCIVFFVGVFKLVQIVMLYDDANNLFKSGDLKSATVAFSRLHEINKRFKLDFVRKWYWLDVLQMNANGLGSSNIKLDYLERETFQYYGKRFEERAKIKNYKMLADWEDFGISYMIQKDLHKLIHIQDNYNIPIEVNPLALNPISDLDYIFYGDAEFALGNFEKAILHYNRFLEEGIEKAHVSYKMGRILVEQTKFQEAIIHFTRASQLQRGYSDSHYWIGYCHENLGNGDKALQAYNQLIEIFPEHLQGLYAVQRLSKHTETKAKVLSLIADLNPRYKKQIKINEIVTLIGFDFPSKPVNLDEPFDLTLYWTLTRKNFTSEPHLIGFHLDRVDEETGILFRQPLGLLPLDNKPVANWVEGQIIKVRYELVYRKSAGAVIKDGKDLSSDAIKALDFSYEPHFDIKVFLEAHERNTNGNVRSTVWPEFGLGRVYIN